MIKATRSIDTNDSFIMKLEFIAQKMNEIVKMYPYPIPPHYIRVPFEKDTLTVSFRRVTHMPIIFHPNYSNIYETPSIEIDRYREIADAKIDFNAGKISKAQLYEFGIKLPVAVSDSYGIFVLSHMILPEVFREVKNSHIYSEKGDAKQWFQEFIYTVEHISRLDEVEQINLLDLLDKEKPIEEFEVVIKNL